MAASLCNLSLSSPVMLKKSNPVRVKVSSFSNSSLLRRRDYRGFQVKAFFLNPMDEPLIKEALKEPVAFMGGMFAGLLRLDLNEDPLKEWVTRTVEATGMTEEEIDSEGSKSDEEAPQEIVIE
ncbi:hypothetical protein C5167_050631 [Papaver somniferum]|uniref:Uncharacterized protein n=1 Tax=Papaver somniferum TaxID=3469 RepID=A0A4Y7KSK4_PAPSO|nr:UPF0426 protein At1g28150, chloroplastic-like isoform X2 [Papaver somniferum]XP_026408300.1 UPF0426 protein At1g28150, chloroplastic-like [Papaver somniferum]RZC75138.1 hypothetical protein C5167_050631 [Papaver somniferum]